MSEKLFRIRADATFAADNIDDAFTKLQEHFRALAEDGVDGRSILLSGCITVEPARPDAFET
jgi:hypothetical protein